jgi:hypothetical protein
VRVLKLRRELTVRREAVKGGWVLRFTGREARWLLLDAVFDDLEILFGTI